MRLIYNTGIRIYWLAAWIISPWNTKAKLWFQGRKSWKEKLKQAFQEEDRVVWFHCASLGEFEQGRPLIEAYRERAPGHRILLTFFSPSGYEKRKDYGGADHVMYLPLDTYRNAKYLVRSCKLEMVLFIKYEFWFHFLRRLKREGVPIYLVSGIFRPDQAFFKWYGGWYRRFLDYFTHIFVQQEVSRKLLEEYGHESVTVTGDTRFDRVRQASAIPYNNRSLEDFVSGRQVIVAGSTWEPDEVLLELAYGQLPEDIRWIIAPHELSGAHIERLQKRFPESVLFTALDQQNSVSEGVEPTFSPAQPTFSSAQPTFSSAKPIPSQARVVIVDTIGQLTYLYRFGTIAYIGGGFGKGIHNILEAAAYGLPVIFGPNHLRFSEAVELIERKGAFPITDAGELISTVRQHFEMNSLLKTSSQIAANYVMERIGATSAVLDKVCIKTEGNMF